MPRIDELVAVDGDDKGTRRAEQCAADWKRDEGYEHLARLRDNGDPAWRQLPPGSRIALGLYEQGKANARRNGRADAQ